MINIQKLKEIKSELKIKRNNEISNYERKHSSFAKTFQIPINGAPCDFHIVSLTDNHSEYAVSSTTEIVCACFFSFDDPGPVVCDFVLP